MNFEEALVRLRDGATVRRSDSSLRWIKLVDPREFRDVDGVSSVFQVWGAQGRVPNTPQWTSQEEAKKGLTNTRRDHTNAWKAFMDWQAKFDASSWAVQQDMKEEGGIPIRPDAPLDFYKGVDIKEVDLPRSRRLNQPFLIALDRKGHVLPWNPTTEDILSVDWKNA